MVPWFSRRISEAESPIRVTRHLAFPPQGPAQKEEPSMDSSHVSALQLKHAGIERQIHEEMSRPVPDAAVVQALKKRKLRLKEEIGRY